MAMDEITTNTGNSQASLLPSCGGKPPSEAQEDMKTYTDKTAQFSDKTCEISAGL